MTRENAVKLKCICGHVMGTNRANTLDRMKRITYWRCHKCGKNYKVKIEIF